MQRKMPAVLIGGLVLFGVVALVGLVGSEVKNEEERRTPTVVGASTEVLGEKAVAVQIAPPPARPEPGAQWSYSNVEDKMGRKKSFAEVTSESTLSFDFPYRGPQHGTLTIRRSAEHGTEATVRVERGQFLCRIDRCSVGVRFDDGPVWYYNATGPADHSTTMLFIDDGPDFVSCVRKAKVVRIEATFYQQGTQILEFSVEGLKWPLPK